MMDALQTAGRFLLRSPSIVKQSWNSSRHQKLPENWTDTRETIVDGMTFNLRHLGMTLVDQPKGEELSAAAVKRIVAMVKASGKKPPKVSLRVSPQGLAVFHCVNNQLLENISIYRISYCTADRLHVKVFAYISQNTINGTLECHAYLCSKRRVAQAVTLTVAQAFKVAFEFWQVARDEKEKRVKSASAGEESHSAHRSNSVTEKEKRVKSASAGEESHSAHRSNSVTDAATGNLLDFDDHVAMVTNNTEDSPPENINNKLREMEDGLDEAFSRLAVSRTDAQVLDSGLMLLD